MLVSIAESMCLIQGTDWMYCEKAVVEDAMHNRASIEAFSLELLFLVD